MYCEFIAHVILKDLELTQHTTKYQRGSHKGMSIYLVLNESEHKTPRLVRHSDSRIQKEIYNIKCSSQKWGKSLSFHLKKLSREEKI